MSGNVYRLTNEKACFGVPNQLDLLDFLSRQSVCTSTVCCCFPCHYPASIRLISFCRISLPFHKLILPVNIVFQTFRPFSVNNLHQSSISFFLSFNLSDLSYARSTLLSGKCPICRFITSLSQPRRSMA